MGWLLYPTKKSLVQERSGRFLRPYKVAANKTKGDEHVWSMCAGLRAYRLLMQGFGFAVADREPINRPGLRARHRAVQPYHKSAPGRIPHGALTAEASGVAAAAPGCRGGPEASQRA